MRAWGCIVAQAGRLQGTPLAHSLYVFRPIDLLVASWDLLTLKIAFWRFCCCKGIPLQTHRLQHRKLFAKLRRFYCRRFSISHRLCPSRCHQDPDTKPKLWKSRVRLQDRGKHDEEWGHYKLLQRPYAQVINDGTEASIQLLASTDVDPGFRDGRLSPARIDEHSTTEKGCCIYKLLQTLTCTGNSASMWVLGSYE